MGVYYNDIIYLPHSLPNVGIIFKIFETFKKASDMHNCDSYQISICIKHLNTAITVKLLCNYTVTNVAIITLS